MHKNTDRRTICIVILIMFSFFLSSAFAEETQENLFKVMPEKQISAPDMDCNYWSEDNGKTRYNFEYPKLIVTDKYHPLIAFVDENSKNIFLSEISNQDVKILYNQSSHDLNSWKRWPIIFARGDKVYFALFSNDASRSKQIVNVFLFDRENKSLNLEKDKIFKINKGCSLWGIYPYNNYFMLIGVCEHVGLRYLFPYLLGGVPVFYHNFSYILDNSSNEKLTGQSIEEQGCYSVKNHVYDVSESGTIQAVWVRNTTTLGLEHDEIIYMSTNKDGVHWSSPVELYSVKNTKVTSDQLNNISLASFGDSSFILWQDREKGIFFSEVSKNNKVEHVKISDKKQVDTIQPMTNASTIKVAADNDGNSYVLWIENIQNVNRVWDYKLHFKVRMNGQWKREIIINKGSGVIKLPDMKVDKEGNVHITYIKSVGEVMQYRGEYACFYMKLERQSKKGQ